MPGRGSFCLVLPLSTLPLGRCGVLSLPHHSLPSSSDALYVQACG